MTKVKPNFPALMYDPATGVDYAVIGINEATGKYIGIKVSDCLKLFVKVEFAEQDWAAIDREKAGMAACNGLGRVKKEPEAEG